MTGRIYSDRTIEFARALREQGQSYEDIAHEIGAWPETVRCWFSDAQRARRCERAKRHLRRRKAGA
jgi:hypothetical protein